MKPTTPEPIKGSTHVFVSDKKIWSLMNGTSFVFIPLRFDGRNIYFIRCHLLSFSSFSFWRTWDYSNLPVIPDTANIPEKTIIFYTSLLTWESVSSQSLPNNRQRVPLRLLRIRRCQKGYRRSFGCFQYLRYCRCRPCRLLCATFPPQKK